MLQAIRDRAQGIFAWVMLIVVGVPFALWGIQNYLDVDKEAPVVTVGDREIFERDINRVFEQNLANLVGLQEFDEAMLKRESQERLVRDELVLQDAAKRGLQISDDTVRTVIQELPFFQTDGHFDDEKYKLALTSQGLSGGTYAGEIRRSMLIEQYQRGILGSGFITPSELGEFLKFRNQERQIEYLTIPKRSAGSTVSDQAAEAYFKEHAGEYQNPEKVSVSYVVLDRNQIAAGIKTTEEELKALYEEQIAQFTTPERRRLSHILIAVNGDKPEADSEALKKAEMVRERLLKGEDFAKVAKEASDDKVSANKGGDLGFMSKDAFDPNVVTAANKLANSEVSAPVKSPFGYHVLKITELVPGAVKPFDSVRVELEKTAQHSAAESRFYELSQSLAEQSFEHPDGLDNAAAAVGTAIQTTDFFTSSEGEGLAKEEAFRKAAFSADVREGKNSEPIELGGEKVVVLRQKDRVPASPKAFSEVKAGIVAKLLDQAATEEAHKKAQAILDAVKGGKTMAEVAKGEKLTLTKSEFFKRNDTALNRQLVVAAFKLASTEKPASLAVLEVDNGDQAILNLAEIRDGDNKAMEKKDLDAARDFLARNASQNEMIGYFAGLRADGDVHERAPRP